MFRNHMLRFVHARNEIILHSHLHGFPLKSMYGLNFMICKIIKLLTCNEIYSRKRETRMSVHGIVHCRVRLFALVCGTVRRFPAPQSSNGSLISREKPAEVHTKRISLARSRVRCCLGPMMKASDQMRTNQQIIQSDQCLTVELMLAAANLETYPGQVFG